MNKPDYLAPKTLNEALDALKKQKEKSKIIAGGTDLVPRMRAGVVNPEISIKGDSMLVTVVPPPKPPASVYKKLPEPEV